MLMILESGQKSLTCHKHKTTPEHILGNKLLLVLISNFILNDTTVFICVVLFLRAECNARLIIIV